MEPKCRLFCHHYLQTASVEKAARLSGASLAAGIAWLEKPGVVRALGRMRARRAAALGDETAVDRLKTLLAGSPADVVKLAFLPPDTPPESLDGLDFSQLAEYRRLSNGTVELKLIDRVDALLTLAERQEKDDASFLPLLRALAPDAGTPPDPGENQREDEPAYD
ncbi:MAG: hypothetical protein LBT60_04975 [Oscillospiraceae bacterium]|jgi:hypothetical protein|nr:hypothetical protein [Oscillospiraceae bacterium]